jgi:phosphoribosylaminoimidazole carboxylase
MDSLSLGVLGAGQLGRMIMEAANRLNISVSFLDAPNAPAKQINALSEHINGSFSKAADVLGLSKKCDILTVEIEHVDTKILEEIAETKPGKIQPSWRTIRTIQDKYRQKEHLIRHGISTTDSIPFGTTSPQGLKEIADRLGYPLMLKSRTEAYDGRGNCPVLSVTDIESAIAALKDRPLYAERWADFRMELAVMVVKTSEAASISSWQKSTQAFPVVETVHEDSICKLTYTPARGVSKAVTLKAQELARKAVSTFEGRGVFGVEMFLLPDSSLLINEIAPRPHNSGHYTIEACHMSQYEAHIRAILPDLSDTITPGATSLITPNANAIMLNILGGPTTTSHLLAARAALTIPGAKIHLYGKGDGRPGRKMGHITLIASTMEEAENKIQPLIDIVDAIRAHRSEPTTSSETILATADHLSSQRGLPTKPKPLVGVTMGSDSDLPVLKAGLAILDEFSIPYEVTITSAHRTPERMFTYAREAASRGLKVIIAAAGGAAHLPGMIASSTPLPIIGVPVKASTLDGLDSLLSIVQMPRGVPVATVAINNSVNAALLAIRILGAEGKEVRERMEEYMAEMERQVLVKAERLEGAGVKGYEEGKGESTQRQKT